MKSCVMFEAELSAWLDGELAREEQIEVVDHLVRCAGCREFYLDARALDGACEILRPSSDARPPAPELWQRIEARAGSRARRGIPAWALRAAAVLVLGAGIAGLMWGTRSGTSQAPREAIIALGEDAGQMTEERFLDLTGEILRAAPRYRAEMYRVMRQVVQETTPSETTVDAEFAGAPRHEGHGGDGGDEESDAPSGRSSVASRSEIDEGEVEMTVMHTASRVGMALVLITGVTLAQQAERVEVEQDPGGFLHGTIETRSGSRYTGLLRWETEEAFWDDLFHGVKEDLPFLKRHQKERRSRITVFGVTVGYSWDEESTGRLLVARFGDIREIHPHGQERAELVMKNGNVVGIDGGSNDVGTKLSVLDNALGDVEIEWEKIQRIVFAPAPTGVSLPASRLYGKVRAAGQTFEGHVQWDKQESLSTDKLDGESNDGDLALAMGQIARIERRSSSSSRVVLHDGRDFILRGTNDVNEENRGICVEDARYGRVTISWDAFESVDFSLPRSSGRRYGEYGALGELRGTVTDRDGSAHAGQLIFDLDEAEGWEILNGSRDEVEYDIPFERVRSIEPDRWDSSRVVLRDGTELLLEEGQDVAENNAGVVVIGNEKQETFIPWQDVRRVEFE